MTLGTGIAIAGIWLFPSMCAQGGVGGLALFSNAVLAFVATAVIMREY